MIISWNEGGNARGNALPREILSHAITIEYQGVVALYLLGESVALTAPPLIEKKKGNLIH